jgi:hypothetical protein
MTLPADAIDASGLKYNEYYLYSNKSWEMAPSGVSFFNLAGPVLQNAPIIVTPSGYEETTSGQPWGKANGPWKYNKVGFGHFDLLAHGQYNPDAKQFSLAPDSSGKLIFNSALRENVYIEYESGPSGYYIMDTVDYNPIRNEVEGGFIHFSETSDPTDLFLTASRSSIRADGYQGCVLTATLYDPDFDRVPDKNIIFEIQELIAGTSPGGGPLGVWSELGYMTPNVGTIMATDASGCAISIQEQTSTRGEAHVHYITRDLKTGIVQIKAYYTAASGIYDTARIAQYYLSSSPFILDISMLDTLDYLT